MTFTILLKLYVWEISVSQVKLKNALSQSNCRIFKLFCMQVHIYQSCKLMMACPDMLKVAIKSLMSQKLLEL